MSAVTFTVTARVLAEEARRAGLMAPGFRSPPRHGAAARTVRRWPSGGLVAVRLGGRDERDVVADMIEGVVVVNGLEGERAQRARRALLAAVEGRREAA